MVLAATPRRHLIAVPVRLDGHPEAMLIDTGADRTLLTHDAVNRLGLPIDQQHASIVTDLAGSARQQDASLQRLDLGGYQPAILSHLPVTGQQA